MALTVNTNIASMRAFTNLSRTSRNLQESFQRISSGLRITKAADDAAGLGVAESLDAQEISARQAMRNTNDGISIIQTAEGSTNEVANIVKRMRELAVQSSSETLASTERAYIQSEYLSLESEVERISQVTEFNGIALANGTNSVLNAQVGVMDSSNDRIAITLGDLRVTTLGIDSGSIDMSTAAGAQAAITTLDTALDTLNGYRSDYGATQNRLDSALTNMETYAENLASAQSQIRDADFAWETAQLSKFQVMSQAGTSILAQANQVTQGAISLLG
jgi:flagellin